jgi:hypothetical protein
MYYNMSIKYNPMYIILTSEQALKLASALTYFQD